MIISDFEKTGALGIIFNLYVHVDDKINQGMLQKTISIHPSTIKTRLEKLEKLGLITITIPKKMPFEKIIELTETGRILGQLTYFMEQTLLQGAGFYEVMRNQIRATIFR